MRDLIRKILKEFDESSNILEYYDPSGNKIKPNKYVIHKSEHTNRRSILKKGLIPKVGFCYKDYVGVAKCRPAVFATNSRKSYDWFAEDWDADVWLINTHLIPDVVWYKDTHSFAGGQNRHILTFDKIPPSALTLIYEGTE